jgi:MFS family permease
LGQALTRTARRRSYTAACGILIGVSDPGGVFAPVHRPLSVGVLVSVTAIAFEGMAVATVLPTTATDLGGLDAYGWAFSAFMLTSLLGAISAGQLSDRGHVVLPARLGLASFAAGLLVAGFAPSWPVLLCGRILQGFGGGSLGAIAYVAIARGYPATLRPRLLALLSSAWIVPALIGPAIAGQIAEHASWRLVFLGILPPVLGGAIMLLPALVHLAPAAPAKPDAGRLAAAGCLAAGIGLLLWGLGLGSIGPTLGFGVVGIGLAAPALRFLLPVGTLTAQPGLPAAVATRGLLAFGFFGSESLIPLGLATVRGLPPSGVGFALTAGALAWVGGSWLQDRDEARTGGSVTRRANRVRGGLALVALGISSIAGVILSPDVPVALAVLAWGVAGLGMGLAYPGCTLTAMAEAGSGREGFASASLQVAETVGIAAGAGAAGALLALAVHLESGVAEGLAWALVLTVAAAGLAQAPAARLVTRLSRRAAGVTRLQSDV